MERREERGYRGAQHVDHQHLFCPQRQHLPAYWTQAQPVGKMEPSRKSTPFTTHRKRLYRGRITAGNPALICGDKFTVG